MMINHKNAGLTLIEILIVMLIISIVAGVAMLTLHTNSNYQLRTEAKQLLNLILLAEQKAIIQSTVIGLSINENSYKFFEFKKKDWQPSTSKAFQTKVLSASLTLKTSNQIPPQIIISPNGTLTPFSIRLGSKFILTGDLAGNVCLKNAAEA